MVILLRYHTNFSMNPLVALDRIPSSRLSFRLRLEELAWWVQKKCFHLEVS